MYEDRTPENIKAEMKQALKTDLDKREGSFVDDLLGPVAVEHYKIYQSLNAVQPMVHVDATSGKYLDMEAEDLGIEPRKTGTKAQVTLTVAGTAGFTIPAGTRFSTADNLYFETLSAVEIPEAGQVEISVQAEQVGEQYNVDTGTILYQFQNDSRIQAVTNASAAMGGMDPESDESLFSRIDSSRKKPRTSGNAYDYEAWACEVSGVGYAKCTPIQYGPGTVGVLVADENRQPVDDAVVTACAGHIETKRPVGADVTVKSAEALAINVTAAVTTDSTTTKETAKAAFTGLLDEYLRSLAFSQYTVLYNRVGALIIGTDGVIDYGNLTLNGVADSVTVGAEQVPVVGEVVFT